MPTEWYLLSQPLYNSGFESDEFSAFATEGFEEVLASFLADDVEIYEKCLSVEPVKTRAVIQGVTADTYTNSTMRQFLTRIGTLHCGQYVKARGEYWLINGLPDNNKMYEKAVGWYCKYSIRFVSPVTGEIVEYPVYNINSTQYGSGETAKTHMTIGTSQHLVYLPYNEETVKLDSGFRFLIDKNREKPTAYRLAQVDTSGYSSGSEHGLIQWTIVESQYDEQTDNKELLIADYYGRSELSMPEVSEEGYTLSLDTAGAGDKVIFGEDIKVAAVLRLNGEEVDALPMEVSITDGVEYGIVKEVGDGYFTIHALDNREYIGQEITVVAKMEEANIESSIILTIRGWY